MASAKISHFQQSAKEKAAGFRHAFSSKEAFLKYVQNPESVNETDPERARWTNRDLDPTPPEQRNWNWFNYCTYYFGLSFGNWTLGSSMIGIGLNWWQSIVVIFISQMIASTAMLYNSKAASTYHIGYPCVARSVYGMWGSYYPVGARAVLAIIWYAVQLYTGASYLSNMLQAIFGHHYTDIPNGMPESMGFTTQQMLGFFLFWLIHIPFVFLRPYQLRGFFSFKSAISFPAMLGLFIYCMATTKGKLGSLYDGSAPSGGQFGWFFMWCINSGMGNTATLITNQPDLARWAKTTKSPTWAQMIVNPVFTTLSATLGILATSAVNNKWGTSIWNQWDLMTAIMERNWRPEVRFAVFLCACCWMISILATNIAANMIPFGADSSMLWPKYLTITRGQAIVHLLGYAVCPWKIMYSASTFVTFLAGYGIFMGPVVAIMICEYYLVSRGNVFIPSLYIGNKNNENYWYKGGWNVQAFIAYIVAIALPFPGFVGTLGPKVSTAAENLGHLGWCLSFVIAFVIYYLLNLVWPHENVKNTKGLRREELADIGVVEGVETGTPTEELSVSLSEKK
ncbi:putative allantoin permease [Xylona heveae TC161]|uniref:Putative allantoin permease n=1 Tax=Xylona heveae (strain CBS 132557 / TC161) TaxID=1328760 RepID=A0A164ZTY3_XYLHT|nr:putative allantoin permease [Xylona heveae TC161]KZF19513.1 putative allantoin permease [Xylona heveae TC161]